MFSVSLCLACYFVFPMVYSSEWRDNFCISSFVVLHCVAHFSYFTLIMFRFLTKILTIHFYVKHLPQQPHRSSLPTAKIGPF